MLNATKRLSATFASAILLAASNLVATPAPAQTGGGGPDQCYPVNSPYDCCEYVEEWGGWYRFYVWGVERCYAYEYQREPDGASQEPPDSPGQ